MKRIAIGVLLSVFSTGFSLGETLRFTKLFGDRMVLQQGKPVTVWGWANPADQVMVTFAAQRVKAKADGDGLWIANLAAMPVSFESRELTATTAEEKVVLKDVLVGEVWVCGGQSNMEWRSYDSSDLERPSADSPAVRYTLLRRVPRAEEPSDLKEREGWVTLGAENRELDRVAAVPYFFGVRLQRFLKSPIGLINTAVGGTTAEVWTSRKTLDKIPEISELVEHLGDDAGAFFHGVVAPIRRCAIRGVLFYQGENNAFDGHETYAHTFPALVKDWRAAFGDEELPFGIISLAGNGAHSLIPEPEIALFHRHSFAHIRDIHFRTFRATKGTGLISIWDLGADYIHPGAKRDVGERAARWALAKVYGKPVYHTAPVFREMKVEDEKARLYFDYDPTVTDQRKGKWYKRIPLPHRAREFRGFMIAGQDRRFFPAKVKVREAPSDERIREECLEAWSEFVSKPVAVRYAWAHQPDANAYGRQGLPVAPFRTDNWPLVRSLPAWAKDRDARERENRELESRLRQWQRDRKMAEAKKNLDDN